MRDKFKKVAGAFMLAGTFVVGAGSFSASLVQAQDYRRYEERDRWRRMREHNRREWRENNPYNRNHYRRGWYDRFGVFHPYR